MACVQIQVTSTHDVETHLRECQARIQVAIAPQHKPVHSVPGDRRQHQDHLCVLRVCVYTHMFDVCVCVCVSVCVCVRACFYLHGHTQNKHARSPEPGDRRQEGRPLTRVITGGLTCGVNAHMSRGETHRSHASRMRVTAGRPCGIETRLSRRMRDRKRNADATRLPHCGRCATVCVSM